MYMVLITFRSVVEAEQIHNGSSKENKEGKLNKKKSEREHSASGSTRKDTKSPLTDATSSPKKTKKKRKVSTWGFHSGNFNKEVTKNIHTFFGFGTW